MKLVSETNFVEHVIVLERVKQGITVLNKKDHLWSELMTRCI